MRCAAVEHLSRRVVALVREQRVDGATDVVMKSAEDLAEVRAARRQAEMMMADNAHAVMEVEAVDGLSGGQCVEPALLDEGMPRGEEGLAEVGPPRDGHGGPSSDDVRARHRGRRTSRVVPEVADVFSRTYGKKTAKSPPIAG